MTEQKEMIPTDEVETLMNEIEQDILEKQDRVVPEYQEKDNQYKFYRELKNTKDSKKIANLTHEEIGKTQYTVRGCLNVGLIADTLELDYTKKFWYAKAEILNATSMSRKAKFLELIFTQIRKTVAGISSGTPLKKGLFSWGKSGNNQGSDTNV